jgi:regulator of sigma E protease
MSWALTFLGIILLILLHELGHFLAAKAVGMRVERFSLFFPPTLLSLRRGETEYALGLLPLGGYVKIAGMTPPAQERDRRAADVRRAGAGDARPTVASPSVREDRSAGAGELNPVAPAAAPDEEDHTRDYFNQAVWKRLVVIGAGPAMNILIAFLILWGVYALSAQTPVRDRARVAEVQAGHPAAGALARGDQIIAVNGHPVQVGENGANFEQEIDADHCAGPPVAGCRALRPVTIAVLRDGKRLTFSLFPRYDATLRRMLLGFSFTPLYTSVGPLSAASASVSEMWAVTDRTFTTIGRAFTSGRARKQLHGIVGLSDVVSQAFSFSISAALFILALLSLSLAIFNLFPFLPLDGGHIFWALAEKVRGRAIPYWVMERASMVGVMLVILLAAIGLSNDIHSLTNGSLALHH